MRPSPKTVFVAIHMADDSIGVMQFVTDDFATVKQEATREAIEAEIARSELGDGKKPIRGWAFLPNRHGDLPTEDRTYRDAWTWRDGKIVHDMPRAREIHLTRVREARARRLDDLDREWMKATGQKRQKDADTIEAERQRLRDLPATLGVEQAQTVEALKALWPFPSEG